MLLPTRGLVSKRSDMNGIFEEFDRGRLANDGRYRGTGLGLAIVKRLVHLLGGSITVESELGKGSLFTVTFHKTAREHFGLDHE